MNRAGLHPYQNKAVDFIRQNLRCGLFIDMGLGKTVITLTAVTDLMDGMMARRALVVAPKRVANSVWAQEAAAWTHTAHLRVSVCTGTVKKRLAGLDAEADVFVINRENVVWLVDQCKSKWPFDTLIIDESSSFKSPSAKRFKKLKKPSQLSKNVICLTGTPSPNGLLDLWPQMYLIDGGEALGRTVTGYRKMYFTPDYWGYSWEIKDGADEKIHARIKSRTLSMTAEDYLELPETIMLTEKVDLPVAVLADYKRFRDDLVLNLDGKEIEAASAAILANKLLQFANGAIYNDTLDGITVGPRTWGLVHDEKLDALSDLIADNPGENILIAYNYRHDLERIRKRFPTAVLLDDKTETIDRWNRGEIKLLLAHPASCGHGINIQHGGSMLVWFGLPWSLELYQQLNARLARQGQTKPVRIIHMVATGTIDERVMRVLGGKATTQKALIDALKLELR